jgi:hypothetical protein
VGGVLPGLPGTARGGDVVTADINMDENRLWRYLGLGVLVAGALAYVSYMRAILTVTGGADVAVVVAGAAFLGLAAGASLAALLGDRAGSEGRPALALNALVFGASAFVVGAAVGYIPLGAAGLAGTAGWLVACAYLLAAAAPLGFAGFAVGVAFRKCAGEPGRVYAAFLVGGAAGVILAAAALDLSGHRAALALTAVLGAGAAACWYAGRPAVRYVTPTVLAACAVVLPPALPFLFALVPARDSFLSAAGGAEDSAWSASARAELSSSAAADAEAAPAFTIFDAGLLKALPGHGWLTVNGRRGAPVAKESPEREFVKKYAPAFAGRVKAPGRALVIGGAGFDALALAALGAGNMDLVINDAAHDLITGQESAGELLRNNRVVVRGGDGRAFLRSAGGTYDLIALSPAALPAAEEGAPSLAVNYLLTVEAFREYYRRLAPAGIVSFTVRDAERPAYGLTVAAALRGALVDEGELQPAACFAVFRRGEAVTVLAKRGGFGELELEGLVGVAAGELEPVYLPGRKARDGGSVRAYASLFTQAGDGGGTNEYEVRPASDDRPFPFAGAGRGRVFGGAVAAAAAVLAAVFIALPLYAFKKRRVHTGGKAAFAAYFVVAGASFPALATALGPKAAFYLGGGAWSGPAALATFWLVAAAGSLWGGAVSRGRRWLPFVVVAAAALLAILAYDVLFAATAGWPVWVRFYVAAVLGAVVGFFLGALAPMGLAAAAGREPATLPWCWAAYLFGFAFAAAGALPAATVVGFRVILAAAALLVIAAWSAFVRAARSHLPPVGTEAEVR